MTDNSLKFSQSADANEALELVKKLQDEGKWAISVHFDTANNMFNIKWEPLKYYTAQDGKQYPEEVWTTQAGDLIQIQDLDPEHCRNILRMLLRQQREATKAIGEFAKELSLALEEITDIDDAYVDMPEQKYQSPSLHGTETLLTPDGPAPGQLLN